MNQKIPTSFDSAPFLCFAGLDWWYHPRAHADFQLMIRMAENRKVLLINSIGMRMPMPGRSTQPWRRVFRKLKSVGKFLRRPLPDRPNFHVVTPLMLPLWGSTLGRKINSTAIRWQIRLLSFFLGIKNPFIFAGIPTAWEVLKPMRRRGLIFNRTDKASEFGETDQDYIRSLEQELLSKADVILYVSRILLDEEKQLTGDRGYFLDHGVDLEHFSLGEALPEPEDVQALKRPRVGFFGSFDDYLVDFDLLERVAREIPDAELVLVGPAFASMKRFEAYDNVHWVGAKPYETMPNYGASFDVALMPWLQNEWIRNCNPIKLKEYLALGLPIVSTDFAELAKYKDFVCVAHSAEEFISLTRQCLHDGGPTTPEERRATVLNASWDQKAEELLGQLPD